MYHLGIGKNLVCMVAANVLVVLVQYYSTLFWEIHIVPLNEVGSYNLQKIHEKFTVDKMVFYCSLIVSRQLIRIFRSLVRVILVELKQIILFLMVINPSFFEKLGAESRTRFSQDLGPVSRKSR